jgi:hypothetical protein
VERSNIDRWKVLINEVSPSGSHHHNVRSERNITALPENLAQTLLANAGHSVNLDEEIDGEVAL